MKKRYIVMIVMWGLVLILGSCHYQIKKNMKQPKIVLTREDKVVEQVKDKIYVYYPDGNDLVDEEIEVLEVVSLNDLINKTAEEVINKLEVRDLIPELDLSEVSLYIVNDRIYLDLPNNIFDKAKNANEDLLIVYSFVNSLTNIDGVKKVKILINHEEVDKLGYVNLSKDYTYRKNI